MENVLDGLNLFTAVYNDECHGGVRFIPYTVNKPAASAVKEGKVMGTEAESGGVGGKSRTTDEEAGLGGPVFEPRLYLQRYNLVCDIINNSGIQPTSVIDFGTAECQLLCKLKNSVSTLQRIIGVDLDKWVIECNSFRLRPLTWDHLHKRAPDSPLTISVYCGSITDTGAPWVTSDTGTDVVTCVELIEHLYDDVLEQVPGVIFGHIKPKLVIMTTPNSEYNVLFPNFMGPFRHWDHKFEWSREEFKSWCSDIVNIYTEYNVTYTGVGDVTPDCTQDVGYCTQVAVFTRSRTATTTSQTTSTTSQTTTTTSSSTSTTSQTTTTTPLTSPIISPKLPSTLLTTSSTPVAITASDSHPVDNKNQSHELVCEFVYPCYTVDDVIHHISGSLYHTLYSHSKTLVDQYESQDVTSSHLTVTASHYIITVTQSQLYNLYTTASTNTADQIIQQYQQQCMKEAMSHLVSEYSDVMCVNDTVIQTLPIYPPDTDDTDTGSDTDDAGTDTDRGVTHHHTADRADTDSQCDWPE